MQVTLDFSISFPPPPKEEWVKRHGLFVGLQIGIWTFGWLRCPRSLSWCIGTSRRVVLDIQSHPDVPIWSTAILNHGHERLNYESLVIRGSEIESKSINPNASYMRLRGIDKQGLFNRSELVRHATRHLGTSLCVGNCKVRRALLETGGAMIRNWSRTPMPGVGSRRA